MFVHVFSGISVPISSINLALLSCLHTHIAVSVAVSVWTLVSMSIERYYAICHPFRSRESRQTKKHAYRILAMVWTLAFITMSPTAIVSKLQQTNQTGNYYWIYPIL